jgi:hypothetical protein
VKDVFKALGFIALALTAVAIFSVQIAAMTTTRPDTTDEKLRAEVVEWKAKYEGLRQFLHQRPDCRRYFTNKQPFDEPYQ